MARLTDPLPASPDKIAHVTNDAYNAVPQRASANQETRTSLARIQVDKNLLEVNSISPAHTGAEDR